MKKICYLLALTFLPCFSTAQELDGLKNALENTVDNVGDNNISAGEEFWVDLFFQIGFYPTWGLLFGFDGETPANYADFNAYPYADGENGLYLPPDEYGKLMRAQLTAHLQTNEDAVYGGFVQAKFSPNRALSLDVNHLQLLETLENPNGTSGGTDHFSITNLNLLYNRVHHAKFQLWWGGGLMLHDGGGVLYGSPSATAGFTWYFKKPLSLYADTQMGWPNGIFARQHQARMQVHLQRFMIYAGYQGTRIGTVNLPNWAMGTGMWF
jgi:hypothetical protein